jgi:Phage tail protein.
MTISTLADLFGFRGYYESNPINLYVAGDGAINSISWTGDNLEKIKVYTSLSFNNGYDWTFWKQAVNGSVIPDLDYQTPIHNLLFKFRVFFDNSDQSLFPVFHELLLEFEPILVFNNRGDTYCTPEIWIEKVGTGAFTLTNISNNNEKFEFDYIGDGEKIYVNSENEYIETSAALIERYSNFNDNYLKLPRGKNVFKVSGAAKIQFRSQFKLI